MSMVKAWVIAAGAAAILAGAGAFAQTAPPAQEPREITLEAVDPLERGALRPGRCGLFLWARDPQAPLVMIALADPVEARVKTAGRLRFLQRTAFGKEMVYGHFERQTFTDGRFTFDVDIRFDTERELRSGAVVKEGVIRARDSRSQWVSMTPVGGLVACQDDKPQGANR
jgi:hypothetical protein